MYLFQLYLAQLSCSDSICLNGGTCYELRSQLPYGYLCKCPYQYEGILIKIYCKLNESNI